MNYHPAQFKMVKAIEMVSARKETFFYRNLNKRMIDYVVCDTNHWSNEPGPLIYAVTDADGAIRYIGKTANAGVLSSRWLRHNYIHHQEVTRNLFIQQLDAGVGPIAVWVVPVRKLRPLLPANVATMSDKALAKNLEATGINALWAQLDWNGKRETVSEGFDDGRFWH